MEFYKLNKNQGKLNTPFLWDNFCSVKKKLICFLIVNAVLVIKGAVFLV